MQTAPPEIPLQSSHNPARQRYCSALILLGLLALTIAQCAQAQTRADTTDASPGPPTHGAGTLSLELGGNGGLYSVHYDRHFRDQWSWRVGIGLMAMLGPSVVSGDEESPSLLVGAPIGIQWLPGKRRWRLEVGLSVAPSLVGGAVPVLWGGPSVGVRHQPLDGGLFFRATLTVTTVATLDDAGIGPGIGLEVGYTF